MKRSGGRLSRRSAMHDMARGNGVSPRIQDARARPRRNATEADARREARRRFGSVAQSRKKPRSTKFVRAGSSRSSGTAVHGPQPSAKPGLYARRRADACARYRREHGGVQRRQQRAAEAAAVSRRGSYRRAPHGIPRRDETQTARDDRELPRLARSELFVRGHVELSSWRELQLRPVRHGRVRSHRRRGSRSSSVSSQCSRHRPRIQAGRSRSGRTRTGAHQPLVLAKPPWRGPARSGANDSRGATPRGRSSACCRRASGSRAKRTSGFHRRRSPPAAPDITSSPSAG